MRLLFFGSPAFAVPSLRALHSAGHEIATVVTRPDKPRGRSGRPAATPVKQAALELGLTVFEPRRASAREAVANLRAARAELGAVVAFGEILRPALLTVAERGFLNVHASLLPDYRGAAPINWALIRGEKLTGVTVIRMAPKLDAGPILAQRQASIGEDENAGELEASLARAGAELLTEVVARLAAGEAIPGRPQPLEAGFFARKLTKEDGKIDWTASAEEIRNRVRGLTPWPGAYCDLEAGGRRVRVALVRVETADDAGPARDVAELGTVVRVDAEGIVIQTGAGLLRVRELKPAGGRTMSAADFARGHRVRPGDIFK